MSELEKIGSIIKRNPRKIESGDLKKGPTPPSEPKCPLCDDAGTVHPLTPEGHVDWGRSVYCICQKERIDRELAEWRLKVSSLPPDSERFDFDSFQATSPSLSEAFRWAKRLAEGQADIKWLTLVSPVDRGKSHLAIAVAHQWLARGQGVRYGFVPSMLAELRHGYERTDEWGYDAQLSFLCKVPLLVLDDLGVERPTEWGIEQLQTIINERYSGQRPLVVTTNRPLDDLRGDDEHRIGSRLRREPWCRVVVIDAHEYSSKSQRH